MSFRPVGALIRDGSLDFGGAADSGPSATTPPDVITQAAVNPRFWRDTVVQLALDCDTSTKCVAQMEKTGLLQKMVAIVMNLVEQKYKDNRVFHALYRLRSNWRKKSAGLQYWINIIFAACAGKQGYKLDGDNNVPDEVTSRCLGSTIY